MIKDFEGERKTVVPTLSSKQKVSETQEEKNARLIVEGKLSFRELEQLGGSLPPSALRIYRFERQNTSQALSQSK